MTLGEIGTAVMSDIRTVCIVMNNGCLERRDLPACFDGRSLGTDVPYDKVAELYGAAGFSPSSIRATRRSSSRQAAWRSGARLRLPRS